MAAQSDGGRRESNRSLQPEEEIQSKISDLAALMLRVSQADAARGAQAARKAVEELSPAEQGALRRAFGGRLREQLLEVFLEAAADGAARSDAQQRVADEELVALVQRLFRQFMSIEGAVVAIATEFMREGQKVKLPGHFANLRGYVLQLLQDGGEDAVDKINDYLGDINRWMAASLRAWELAPDRWWTEWWERLSPQAIEQAARVAFLGNRFGTYWKSYREMARDLTPPEAKSQILEIAGRIARQAMS